MDPETYTPGHSENATDFMSHRSLQSHGQFFAGHLHPGDDVLDCGCGPGTISVGIAAAVAPGNVTGIDFAETQIEQAKALAANSQVENASFQAASCYELPFPDSSFDAVFSHALMEHLTEPTKALREFYRVLKPGGHVGICSPDFGGLLLAPHSQELDTAVAAYASMQKANGGDLHVGHKLVSCLAAAGFTHLETNARYECYPQLTFIGEYLALQLE